MNRSELLFWAQHCHLHKCPPAGIRARSDGTLLSRGASHLFCEAGKSLIDSCEAAGCYATRHEQACIAILCWAVPSVEMSVSAQQALFRSHAFACRHPTYVVGCLQKLDGLLPVCWLQSHFLCSGLNCWFGLGYICRNSCHYASGPIHMIFFSRQVSHMSFDAGTACCVSASSHVIFH